MRSTQDGQKFLGGHILTGVHDYHPYFHGLSNPSYEPGGKLVYAARRDKGVAVFVGDDAGQEFSDIVSPIIFSPDAQHFAYVAQLGGNLVEVHDNHAGFHLPRFRPHPEVLRGLDRSTSPTSPGTTWSMNWFAALPTSC